MDNSEKLATHRTQDEENQSKNKTQYVLDTTILQTNTKNVSKTRALPQTTGSKGQLKANSV